MHRDCRSEGEGCPLISLRFGCCEKVQTFSHTESRRSRVHDLDEEEDLTYRHASARDEAGRSIWFHTLHEAVAKPR